MDHVEALELIETVRTGQAESAATEVVEMHGTRRLAHYTLAVKTDVVVPVELGAEEERIVTYARETGSISRRECEELLNVSPLRARYLLRKLRDKGVLYLEGKRRWTRYLVQSGYGPFYGEKVSP